MQMRTNELKRKLNQKKENGKNAAMHAAQK
jgi:hypothetical protein